MSVIWEGKDPVNCEINEGLDRPLKVRWLIGPKAGAVENLDLRSYYWARAGAYNPSCLPACEPVDDHEPICPAIRIKHWPGSMFKARLIAAEALGKEDPEELTFKEVVAYFEKLPKKASPHMAAVIS